MATPHPGKTKRQRAAIDAIAAGEIGRVSKNMFTRLLRAGIVKPEGGGFARDKDNMMRFFDNYELSDEVDRQYCQHVAEKGAK